MQETQILPFIHRHLRTCASSMIEDGGYDDDAMCKIFILASQDALRRKKYEDSLMFARAAVKVEGVTLDQDDKALKNAGKIAVTVAANQGVTWSNVYALHAAAIYYACIEQPSAARLNVVIQISDQCIDRRLRLGEAAKDILKYITSQEPHSRLMERAQTRLAKG